MALNTEIITEALKDVNYPGFSRDIVSFGLIKDISISGKDVQIKLELTSNNADIPAQIEQSIKARLKQMDDIGQIQVETKVKSPHPAPTPPTKDTMPENLRGVTHIIAVASGKGGVGKSTVAVNLACALKQLSEAYGYSKGVGMMDCDIYGPTVPLMLGNTKRPEVISENIIPIESHGIRMMSMGLLIDDDAPVVWRGPMVTSAINQFAANVAWGNLDFLVIDLPPGTGDAQLAMTQVMSLTGAIIVTTPQSAAVNVALRGAHMFPKVNTPLFGVIENMSYFQDSQTGQKQYIFGQGGGQRTADALNIPLLGEIPLDPDLRENSDAGTPQILAKPESDSSQAFMKITKKVIELTRK